VSGFLVLAHTAGRSVWFCVHFPDGFFFSGNYLIQMLLAKDDFRIIPVK
jgi:hypothetical protein